MRWHGETRDQYRDRVMSDWHRHFCLFPTQMRDGSWVWLEYVWRLAVPGVQDNLFWRYSASVCKPDMPYLSSPPPPKGGSGGSKK